MMPKAHWLAISLLLGALSLAIPLGMVAMALVGVVASPDRRVPPVGTAMLVGYLVPFAAQCIHWMAAARRFGRTRDEAGRDRLRALFLGPIGVFLNVRDLTATWNGASGGGTGGASI
jgi:hypothetical protein